MTTRTIPDKCRGCGAPIAWVFSIKRPKSYANVPVDWVSLGASTQQFLKQGLHVDFDSGMISHFTTCSHAAQFSNKGKKRATDKP